MQSSYMLIICDWHTTDSSAVSVAGCTVLQGEGGFGWRAWLPVRAVSGALALMFSGACLYHLLAIIARHRHIVARDLDEASASSRREYSGTSIGSSGLHHLVARHPLRCCSSSLSGPKRLIDKCTRSYTPQIGLRLEVSGARSCR